MDTAVLFAITVVGVVLLDWLLIPREQNLNRALQLDYRDISARGVATLVEQKCSNDGKVCEESRLRAISAGRRYNVELILRLPDSPSNRDVGVFQVGREGHGAIC